MGQVANIISDRWDNRAPLSILRSKVLIIHGASDEVVPFRHAEVLRDVRKSNGLPCVFFPTQGTHNYFSYYRDYLQPVENFLATLDTNWAPRPRPSRCRRCPTRCRTPSFLAQVREITDRRRRIAERQEQERARRAEMGAASVSSLSRDVAGLMRGDSDDGDEGAGGGGAPGGGPASRRESRRSPIRLWSRRRLWTAARAA